MPLHDGVEEGYRVLERRQLRDRANANCNRHTAQEDGCDTEVSGQLPAKPVVWVLLKIAVDHVCGIWWDGDPHMLHPEVQSYSRVASMAEGDKAATGEEIGGAGACSLPDPRPGLLQGGIRLLLLLLAAGDLVHPIESRPLVHAASGLLPLKLRLQQALGDLFDCRNQGGQLLRVPDDIGRRHRIPLHDVVEIRLQESIRAVLRRDVLHEDCAGPRQRHVVEPRVAAPDEVPLGTEETPLHQPEHEPDRRCLGPMRRGASPETRNDDVPRRHPAQEVLQRAHDDQHGHPYDCRHFEAEVHEFEEHGLVEPCKLHRLVDSQAQARRQPSEEGGGGYEGHLIDDGVVGVDERVA
mmetsp:Transcript_109561/g.244601  ORF Transcript_109561/g.244601 Transcript_109561/m.244601 type:complete len:352 (+) Transcript_109561:900-1955(+)